MTDVGKIQVSCLYFEYFVHKIYLTSAKFVIYRVYNINLFENFPQHGRQASPILIVLWQLSLEICAVLENYVNYVI
jgi:hypothetical protein